MRILVPTDCSDLAAVALKPAKLMAKKFGAEIIALNVINAPVDAVFSSDGELIDDEEFDTTIFKKELKEGNSKILDWAKKNDTNVEPIVRTGLQIETILKVIERQNIDLVVMSTHGASGLKGAIHGSTAERIVLNAKVPVFTVKESFNSFDSIALANNFRRLKVRIGFVKKLQEAFGSTLHLVRVNTPRKFMSEDEALEGMKAFVKDHALTNVEYHLIKGKKIDEALADFCKIKNIDVLAIGSKQRKGLISVMRGCPSKEIVNHMQMPVLTFRSTISK